MLSAYMSSPWLVAVHELFFVFFHSVFIGFLYAAARGRVVAGGGEPHERPVEQFQFALHQSFAEGAASDDNAPVPVLYGSRYDFAGRCRVFIYQYGQLPVFIVAVAGGQCFLPVLVQPFGVDNELSFAEELVGQLDGRSEVSAPVALQVEYEMAHALCAEGIESAAVFLHGCRSEAVYLDVADAVVYQVAGVDGVDGNLVADDFERKQFPFVPAQHAYVHFRTPRAAQTFHNVGRFHFDTGNERVFNVNHAVAGQYADFLGRAAGNGLHDKQGVFQHLELYANAVETALQRFTHPFHFFFRNVGGVRVQFLQYGDNGVFNDFFVVNAVHVQVGHGHEHVVQFALFGG